MTTPQDYSELGLLLVTVAVIAAFAPLVTVWLIQRTRFRTQE